jgi:hypothetical protein
VRTKVHRKDYSWYVGLVYDPTELPRVMIVRPKWLGCYILLERSTLYLP